MYMLRFFFLNIIVYVFKILIIYLYIYILCNLNTTTVFSQNYIFLRLMFNTLRVECHNWTSRFILIPERGNKNNSFTRLRIEAKTVVFTVTRCAAAAVSIQFFSLQIFVSIIKTLKYHKLFKNNIYLCITIIQKKIRWDTFNKSQLVETPENMIIIKSY